jgi:hypothetical protein
MKVREIITILALCVVLCVLTCEKGSNSDNVKIDEEGTILVYIGKDKELSKKLEIHISGYYIAWSKVNYEYTIKKIENEQLLSVEIESGGTFSKLYEKTLTNDEMDRIFGFINEHDIENMLVDTNSKSSDVKWVSPHDFRGSIIIHIDDKSFENTINSSQKFETNLYAVLNFLNDHIDDKEYFMPISGVIHRSESKVVQ